MALEHAVQRERSRRRNTPRQKHTRRSPAVTPETTPTENIIDVAPEGTSGETLNQRRLREFYELDELYQEVKRRRELALTKIQELIIHGAQITQGTYKVAYGLHARRHPRYKQALIDAKGKDYQKRVLEETAPHQYFRVRVS